MNRYKLEMYRQNFLNFAHRTSFPQLLYYPNSSIPRTFNRYRFTKANLTFLPKLYYCIMLYGNMHDLCECILWKINFRFFNFLPFSYALLYIPMYSILTMDKIMNSIKRYVNPIYIESNKVIAFEDKPKI